MDIKDRFNNFIKDSISDIIRSEYKRIGYDVKNTDVEVRFQRQITITINLENPNLGVRKFEFLDDVKRKVKEAVGIFGYAFESSEDFYGFWICKFKFSQ